MAPFSWLRWLRSWFRPQGKTFRKRSRALSLEHLETRITPATYTWKGALGATGNQWNVASNWVENAVPLTVLGPGQTNNLVFSSQAQVLASINNIPNTNGVLTVNSITISSVSGFQLSGNAITLGNPNTGGGLISLSNSALNETIGMNVTLGGPAAPTVAQDHITVGPSSLLTITGNINGNSGADLISNGLGTLILAADNSGGITPANGINGPIDISAGILSITNANALGNSAVSTNVTTVETNATLQVDNTGLTGLGTINSPINETLLINGPGISNVGALSYLGGAIGNSAIWASNITMDANSTIGVGTGTGALTIKGVIGDNGTGHNLTKEGAGTVILTAANTYRGTTTINNGVVVVRNNNALGHAPIGNATSGNADDLADTAVSVNTSPTETGTLLLDGANAPLGSLTVSKQLLILNTPFGSNPRNQSADGATLDHLGR